MPTKPRRKRIGVGMPDQSGNFVRGNDRESDVVLNIDHTCDVVLDLDMAIAYWNIVLSGRFKFLELWCKFLQVSC